MLLCLNRRLADLVVVLGIHPTGGGEVGQQPLGKGGTGGGEGNEDVTRGG